VIEPAPQSTVVGPPPEGCAFAVVAFAGLLLGAAVVLGLFRAELFRPSEERPESSTTETSTTETTTTTTTETFSFHITIPGPAGTTTFVLPSTPR